MRVAEIQRERWFIIGIIEEPLRTGRMTPKAVMLYNNITSETIIVSLDKVLKMIDSGVDIAGAKIHILYKNMNIIREAYLTATGYNTRKLPIINGNGEVIKPGKSVIIGRLKKDGEIKYKVVNASQKIDYITFDEIIKDDYVGIGCNGICKKSTARLDKLINEEDKVDTHE